MGRLTNRRRRGSCGPLRSAVTFLAKRTSWRTPPVTSAPRTLASLRLCRQILAAER